MSLFQAFLCGIVYLAGGFGITEAIGWAVSPALSSGFLVGCILGDPLKGAMVGGSINLLFLGLVSAGGSMPSDQKIAGIMGAAMAITGGLTTEQAIALAVPIGLIGTVTWTTRLTVNSVFVRLHERLIDEHKYNLLWIPQLLLPALLGFLIAGVPCMLAVYFGANYIQGLMDIMSGKVLTIINIIAGLMPTVGIAITLSFLFKGEFRPFLFLGFILAVKFGMDLLTLGLIGLCLAVIYVALKPREAR
ncbi:MAG: PTS sugar transporter subunit IIC [Erysipelotrichaceae bacterium]|nr:PTS sugar transporter subunit IIC [Erysipelotrichaceae bacterium]